jgi:hypothetical protein
MPAVGVALIAAGPWLNPAAGAMAPQVPALPRVYVHTGETGDPSELRERQASVKDLRAGFARKKKDLLVVDDEARADFDVEVVDRTTVVPKIRIGLTPPGAGGPARLVHLRVKLTHGDESMEFTNKNTAYDVMNGWSSAADDIVRQIDQWIVLHKGRDRVRSLTIESHRCAE